MYKLIKGMPSDFTSNLGKVLNSFLIGCSRFKSTFKFSTSLVFTFSNNIVTLITTIVMFRNNVDKELKQGSEHIHEKGDGPYRGFDY